MILSTIIEKQEERDKHSIGLAGLKEVDAKKPLNNESPRGKKETTPILALDNKCVNCYNN